MKQNKGLKKFVFWNEIFGGNKNKTNDLCDGCKCMAESQKTNKNNILNCNDCLVG